MLEKLNSRKSQDHPLTTQIKFVFDKCLIIYYFKTKLTFCSIFIRIFDFFFNLRPPLQFKFDFFFSISKKKYRSIFIFGPFLIPPSSAYVPSKSKKNNSWFEYKNFKHAILKTKKRHFMNFYLFLNFCVRSQTLIGKRFKT